MSNQPEQPQPEPGQPGSPTPPYVAPSVPPPYVAPVAYGQAAGGQYAPQQPYGQHPQYAQPHYAQQKYAQPQFGAQQYAAPTYYQGGPGYVDNTSGPRGMSLASMIIGLVSLVAGFGFFMIPQVVGIVLGHIGLKKESPQGRSFSITGLITNYLALLIYGALYGFVFIGLAMMGFDSYSPDAEGYTWLAAAH
ncbi:DUF4190 domain-containing protein [Arthrobacter sp. HLT1-20]